MRESLQRPMKREAYPLRRSLGAAQPSGSPPGALASRPGLEGLGALGQTAMVFDMASVNANPVASHRANHFLCRIGPGLLIMSSGGVRRCYGAFDRRRLGLEWRGRRRSEAGGRSRFLVDEAGRSSRSSCDFGPRVSRCLRGSANSIELSSLSFRSRRWPATAMSSRTDAKSSRARGAASRGTGDFG